MKETYDVTTCNSMHGITNEWTKLMQKDPYIANRNSIDRIYQVQVSGILWIYGRRHFEIP